MKISRKALLIIIAGLGILIISYSLFRHFTGIGLDDELERLMMNIVVFTALGIFVYNRKMAQDEKRAKEAAENEKQKTEEPADGTSTGPHRGEGSSLDESLPHWERYKNDEDSKNEPD